MGILKALSASAGSVLRDQYKEMFYCDALSDTILAVRGKPAKDAGSCNQGDENIITRGSLITVHEGQAALIVSQGKAENYMAEPGQYVYDDSIMTGIFSENVTDAVKADIKEIGSRFTFGGVTPLTQRIYYFNTKEIPGEDYETGYMPVRFKHEEAGIDIDVSVRCRGKYSFRIVNPGLFYENVCGNITNSYLTENIRSQLTSDVLTVFPRALAELSAPGMRFYEVVTHMQELTDILNTALSDQWRNLRGIELVSAGISEFGLKPEDSEVLRKRQLHAALADAQQAEAYLRNRQTEAETAVSGKPYYHKCSRCGWVAPGEGQPPAVCPVCGDPFDAKDIVMKKRKV